MNNRFTERAQEAIQQAHEILSEKQHTQLDVEHILLALLKQQDSTVTRILHAMNVDTARLIASVDLALTNIPRSYGSNISGGLQIYITMRVKRLFEVAAEEADRLSDSYISTEHLFLAVAAERTGASARLLQEFGIDQDKIYAALKEVRAGVATHSEDTAAKPAKEGSTRQQLAAARLRITALEKQVVDMRQQIERLRLRVEAMTSLLQGELGKLRPRSSSAEQVERLEQKVDELLKRIPAKEQDA